MNFQNIGFFVKNGTQKILSAPSEGPTRFVLLKVLKWFHRLFSCSMAPRTIFLPFEPFRPAHFSGAAALPANDRHHHLASLFSPYIFQAVFLLCKRFFVLSQRRAFWPFRWKIRRTTSLSRKKSPPRKALKLIPGEGKFILINQLYTATMPFAGRV